MTRVQLRLTTVLWCVATFVATAPAWAQCDVSGEWSARSREDTEDRALLGTNLGDYTGIPLNDAGRQFASTWDASILSLKTQQAIPHPPQYFMRGPGPNIRIARFEDPGTHEVKGYTIVGPWGVLERVIWTDGRSHPPPYIEGTYTGFSTGRCERGMFVVETTHMKSGYHRRNGVPASPKAKMTEWFIRHGDDLTHVQFTEDPVYLTEVFVRTTDLVRNPAQTATGTAPQVIADEIVGREKGSVPSYPLGTKHEFADLLGVPFDATQGHAEAMYPEYLQKLRDAMRQR